MQLWIDSDPFLQYRPFPVHSDHRIILHWHEIAFSAAFYFATMAVAPAINRLLFGDYYTKMENKKKKLDFNIHIAAMVQAFVSISICIPMFAHPIFAKDPIFGNYDFAGLATALTCGYFVWDLVYCCIVHFDIYGFEYLFHGFGALVVFSSTFLGYCQPLIPAFLIFELSTPFVNLNWFFTRGPKDLVSNRTFLINGLLLMVTFFFSRCVWGVYASIRTFLLCIESKDRLPRPFIPVIFTLNLGFHYLNFHWFSKMVHIARKQATKVE